MTVVIIVSVTLGFEQFFNIKQVASFAVYNVIERKLGTSIKGKARISIKGNILIWIALHFLEFIAKRYNENMKNVFNRIQEKIPHKIGDYIALQRKLKTLIYVLWKNNSENIDDYEKNKNQEMKKSFSLFNA